MQYVRVIFVMALFFATAANATGLDTVVNAVKSAKAVKKDFEAELKIKGKENEGRVGKAEWKDYVSDGQRFKLIINKKAETFAEPIAIDLNGQVLGTANRKIVAAGGKEVLIYTFDLRTAEGAVVPAVKEGDVVRLKAADGVEVLGTFVPD